MTLFLLIRLGIFVNGFLVMVITVGAQRVIIQQWKIMILLLCLLVGLQKIIVLYFFGLFGLNSQRHGM